MLFSGHQKRPVALYRLGADRYVVNEVGMSPAGEPVWVRLLPVDASGAPSRWTYHKGGRHHFVQAMHEPVYIYNPFDPFALGAALGDAQNEGYEFQ